MSIFLLAIYFTLLSIVIAFVIAVRISYVRRIHKDFFYAFERFWGMCFLCVIIVGFFALYSYHKDANTFQNTDEKQDIIHF